MKQQIKMFMGATGTLPEPLLSKEELLANLKARYDFLLEEMQELKKALDKNDVVEAVDAIFDIEVFHQQNVIDLEAAGVNYLGCCQEVAHNNALKFSSSKEYMISELERWYHKDSAFADSLYVDENYYDNYTWYCLKSVTNHKVKKTVNFPKVDFSEHIPKELL